MSRISKLPLRAKHIIVIAAVSVVCLTSAAANASAAAAISGRVTDADGHVLTGVTMTVTMASGNRVCPVTLAGAYTCSSLAMRGKYTITPTKESYTFTPASRTYENLSGNFLDQNFVGAPAQSANPNRDRFEASQRTERMSVLLPRRYWS
jgi:hypothetical protein